MKYILHTYTCKKTLTRIMFVCNVEMKVKRSAAKSGGGERGGRGTTKVDEGTLHGKRDDAYVISPDTKLKY